MNVAMGLSAAGATWPPPWRAFQRTHPREAATLKVFLETPHLVNNAVMARKDIPGPLRAQVREALLRLHEDPTGRRILARMETRAFLPASDKDYEGVRAFVARFERDVRPVDRP